MAYPDNYDLDLFPSAATLAAGNLGDFPHSLLHGITHDAVLALEKKLGHKRIHVGEFQMYPNDHPSFISGAANTLAFNVFAGAETSPCEYVFEPGQYDHTGLLITNKYQTLVGTGGKLGTELRNVAPGTSTDGVYFLGAGSDTDRIIGFGARNIKFSTTNEANRLMRIRSATTGVFISCEWVGSRADGAIWASGLGDTHWIDCSWLGCGSIDDSDYAVIKFNYDGNGHWAVDACTFLACRFENNGDRIYDFRSSFSPVFLVNKIKSIGCKYESSGSNNYILGGSAPFYFDGGHNIIFADCDFTLQARRTGHAIIPACFQMNNAVSLHLSSSMFNFANQQTFTNIVLANNPTQLVSLTDTWINGSGGIASIAGTSLMLKATNNPTLVQRNVGFYPSPVGAGGGGSKVATDWFTAAEWKGLHSGASGGAGGAIA